MAMNIVSFSYKNEAPKHFTRVYSFFNFSMRFSQNTSRTAQVTDNLLEVQSYNSLCVVHVHPYSQGWCCVLEGRERSGGINLLKLAFYWLFEGR
jgi:hypothetical protein